MTACPDAMEVEDLVLGLLEEDAAAAIEAHASSCARCKSVQAQFVAERALFERRVDVLPAPPRLVTPCRPLLARIGPSRIVPALAGLAAGIAALVANTPRRPQVDCVPPIASAAIAASATGDDAALACWTPSSASRVKAPTLASHEAAPLACVPSESATCDVPAWMLVTSSVASP